MTRSSAGRWRRGNTIGEGAQGDAFFAEDTSGVLPGKYVLKRLRDARRLERFRREVASLKMVESDHVLRIVDYDLESQPAYLITEYCQGGDLERNGSDWFADPDSCLQLFRQVCQGVAAVHALGLVHRDIKPANVLLRTKVGPAVIADFGIAYLPDTTRETVTGDVMGPRWFTAPELELGNANEVLSMSDVYSLGKLLYWLLSEGRRLPREMHRDPGFDLVRTRRNPYLEHINRLLDEMIVYDQFRRLHNAQQVLDRLNYYIPAFRDRRNPPSSDVDRVWQRCSYCGLGSYRVAASGKPYGLENFISDPIPRHQLGEWNQSADWRILICQTCGHLQLFRIENALKKEWWQ